MAYLEFINTAETGKAVQMEGELFVIGRDETCQLQVVDNRVSRFHARFQRTTDSWTVEDLQSKNGITVNGDLTTSNDLKSGDVVGVGPFLFRFINEPLKLACAKIMDRDEVTRAVTSAVMMPESQRRLNLLLEIAGALDSIASPQDLLERFSNLVVHLFKPSCSVVRFHADEHGYLDDEQGQEEAMARRTSPDLLARLSERAEAFLIGDTSDEPGLSQGIIDLGIASAMGTPILLGPDPCGFIYVDRRGKHGKAFVDNDLLLLIGVGRLVSAAAAGSNRFARLDAENRLIKASRGQAGLLLGESPAMKSIRTLVETKIAPVKTTVLLLGQTGTGKTMVAEAIHLASPRASGPFVKLNCAAIPRELLESELFGHEKGAFSGATARKLGLFEVASGGTLFLDEVGELEPRAQAKLLAAIQEKQIMRVGSTRPVQVDVRFIAASNRDLLTDVENQRFRADLYYRLNVVKIDIPPLRDRREDIPRLAAHFLVRACHEVGRRLQGISEEAMAALVGHSWPGNVRELANCIERAVIFTNDDQNIQLVDLPEEVGLRRAEPALAAAAVDDPDEREMILQALAQAKGNKREAARKLGWYPQKFYHRLRRYGIIGPEDEEDGSQD